MTKTFIIDKRQKPIEEQLRKIIEAKNILSYLMRMLLNYRPQFIKHLKISHPHLSPFAATGGNNIVY